MRKNILNALALLVMVSCGKDKTRYTPSGMKYVLHSEHNGIKPVIGDYVTFDMIYKTESDSVLFDSRLNNSPFRIQLISIPFSGSLEEGLTFLSEGDSATFFVSADSLRANMLSKHLQAGRESLLKPGTLARFDVHLLRVQRKADAEKEIAERLAKRKSEEPARILDFIQKGNYIAVADSGGMYIIGNTKAGSIHAGDTVSVLFSGKYLNGVPFYSNAQSKRPLDYIVGSGQVVPGWDMAFPKLGIHDSVILVIPSALAYGEKGLFSPERGNYIVPPYTPLAYEINIISVRPGKKATARR